jgi:DNA-binding winged helix-turn-helix (wHTH) protein
VSVHVRYRFGAFVLSRRQRLLSRDGRPVPLIPKYLDVLLLLVTRRDEAVSKSEIFDQVWSDVVVSDGALSQAVRTLRRVLDDDAREARYIRTVSRHGYQFVWPDVLEESDDVSAPGPVVSQPPAPMRLVEAEALDRLIDQLLAAVSRGSEGDEDARDLAARLHHVGAEAAVTRLASRPNHGRALAVMRDARWAVPDPAAVPLLADPEAGAAIAQTIRLRVGAHRHALTRRWAASVATGALGGAVAGMLGGASLMALPSRATWEAPVALAAIGALAGAAGAMGLGGGLALAEVAARSQRLLALVACAALGTAAMGGLVHVVARALLEGLFGVSYVIMAGPFQGLVLGATAGLGYGVATRRMADGGLAAPAGVSRLTVALSAGAACAAGGVSLSLGGDQLVGGLVHDIARATSSTQLVLAPLGRLLGEPEFGPVTRALLAAVEGGVLGGATTWGLTVRPRRPI